MMKTKPITYAEFKSQYINIKGLNNTYRLGQHFVNCFIVGDLNEVHTELWNSDFSKAEEIISKLIAEYNWDYNALPFVVDNWEK